MVFFSFTLVGRSVGSFRGSSGPGDQRRRLGVRRLHANRAGRGASVDGPMVFLRDCLRPPAACRQGWVFTCVAIFGFCGHTAAECIAPVRSYDAAGHEGVERHATMGQERGLHWNCSRRLQQAAEHIFIHGPLAQAERSKFVCGLLHEIHEAKGMSNG